MTIPAKAIVPITNGDAGSAGKTTTTVTLAALLAAEHGRQVLLIDADPQGTATGWVGVDPRAIVATTGDVMMGRTGLADALLPTVVDGLRVLPATGQMDADAFALVTAKGREIRLQAALRDCPDDIDVILIDCPGSFGMFTMSALVVATSVIAITAPSDKELKGVPKVTREVADVARYYNEDLTVGAIVPCMVPPPRDGAVYQEAYGMLVEAYGGPLLTPPVRRTSNVPSASSNSVPLPLYVPRAGVTKDYRAVLTHIQQAGVL